MSNQDARGQAKNALYGALRYSSEGFNIVAIHAGQKKPVGDDWQLKPARNPSEVESLNASSYGILLGLGPRGRNYIAVDHDDYRRIPELAAAGIVLPETRSHMTFKGEHDLYVLSDGATLRSKKTRFNFVEIRGEGSQILCPGSTRRLSDKKEARYGGLSEIEAFPSNPYADYKRKRFTYQIKNDAPIAELPLETLRLLLRPEDRQQPEKADCNGAGEVDVGQRHNTAKELACALARKGLEVEEIYALLIAERNKRFADPATMPDSELKDLARWAVEHGRNMSQELLIDPRPKLLLPGDNRLLSDFGAELGDHLWEELYIHAEEVVTIKGGLMCPVSAQMFRTLVERRVLCFRKRNMGGGLAVTVAVTMKSEDAQGILASPQFKAKLRPIRRVNTCRVPVCRSSGRIDLLPEGYDSESQTITINSVPYAEDVPFDSAVRTLEDLFAEFVFADNGRSKAVAVSALMGLYAAQILPQSALRPCFIIGKNAEGAGATTLAACAIVPLLGSMPTQAMPTEDQEMRKVLTSAVRKGSTVIVFDNVKGKIGLPALEAFLTASTWEGRLLGGNELYAGPNLATVFCTANGASVTPDTRRRTLFIDLHLDVERAEDRRFKRPLNLTALKHMRADLLAACWSFLRNWDKRGRPQASRSHSAWPEWAGVIGGIVEAAGFQCPLETPTAVADADLTGMRLLVAAMKQGKPYTAGELACLCRREEIFPELVGHSEEDMSPALRSAFGWMLKRYCRRRVREFRFVIEGEGRQKRYKVEVVEGGAQVA